MSGDQSTGGVNTAFEIALGPAHACRTGPPPDCSPVGLGVIAGDPRPGAIKIIHMASWAVAAQVAVSGYHTDPPELV